MPTYVYRCDRCGTHSDHDFPMGQAAETVDCPHHGPTREYHPARRVFLPPAAIHFKGPGFYATDVTSRVARKRRPNVGDDLPREFDHGAARIADAI